MTDRRSGTPRHLLPFPSPDDLWGLIRDAVLDVVDEQESRLTAEIEMFGLDEVGVPGVVEFVSQSDAEAALTAFRRANPDLDLSPRKLQRRAKSNPYSLAVGVLKTLRPEH